MYKLIYEEKTIEPNTTYTTSVNPSYYWIKKIRFFDLTSYNSEYDFNSTVGKFLEEGNKRFIDFIKI